MFVNDCLSELSCLKQSEIFGCMDNLVDAVDLLLILFIRNSSLVQYFIMVSKETRRVSKVNRGGQLQEFTRSRI